MYRLLVVDDEAGHRAGLIGLLCMLKPEYLVFEAENGERALQMMSVMSFDLVLSDIRMPIMDGMSFLTAVKSKYKHTRFAILSAYGTFEYAKQGLELGADDYLLKPVETEELRTCLDRMEGRVQDERLLEQEQEAMHHNLLNMQSTYFEQQIYRFVMGDLPMSEEKDVRIIFGSEGSGVLVYARPDNGRIEASVRDHLRFMFRYFKLKSWRYIFKSVWIAMFMRYSGLLKKKNQFDSLYSLGLLLVIFLNTLLK